MKLLLKIYSAFFFFFLLSVLSIAQTSPDQVEMADVMHVNGKIYVVVSVLAVVFAGIVFYLVSIDRKVNKMEKRMKDK